MCTSAICLLTNHIALQTEVEDTPLQMKLNVLAEKIAKLGGAAALLILLVLVIEFFVVSKIKKIPMTGEMITQNVVQVNILVCTCFSFINFFVQRSSFLQLLLWLSQSLKGYH
jgi:hypothetical protein